MLVYTILNLLFFAACHALEMRLWQGSRLDKSRWLDTPAGKSGKPTWHAEYALSDVFKEKQVGDITGEDVVEVAALLYKWLVDAHDNFDVVSTPNKICLVAVLWDPQTAKFWASTIPQGPRKASMIMFAQPENPGMFNPKAPAWFAQIQTLVTGTGDNRNANFHAEDGAFFNWESAVPASRVNNGQYTGNIFAAVYGKTKAEGNPQIWDLCGGTQAGTRNPSCRTVAGNLDVRWERRPRRRRRDDTFTKDENEADYVGVPLTTEDYAAADVVAKACGALSAKARLLARDDPVACSSYLSPPALSASPLPASKIASEVHVGSTTVPAKSSTTQPPPNSTMASPTPTDHFCSPTFTSIGTDAVSVWCTCKDGRIIPTPPTTLDGGWPCPKSDIPKQATINTDPELTRTLSGQVYDCVHTETYTSAVPNGITTITQCVGSTSLISTLPTTTIRVEASTGTGAFVGEMGTASATALAYNVSSAIMEACTKTASDGSISCPGSATIPGVPYPSETNMAIGYGDLTFGFGGGTVFENDTMLNVIASAAGHAAAHSVLQNDQNCKTVRVEGVCGDGGRICTGSILPYEFPMCAAANGLLLEFYDGIQTDGPTNAVWITFEFTDPSGLDVINVLESACDAAFAAIDFANAFLLLFKQVPVIGQILSAGTIAAEDVVRGTCSAIESVAHGIEGDDA